MNLIVLSLMILNLYLVGMRIKHGTIPESISATAKQLRDSKKETTILFTLVLWSCAILFALESQSPVMFLAAACIGFVGAAPEIWKKYISKVHVTFAFLGFILALISLWIDFKADFYFLLSVLFVVLFYFIFEIFDLDKGKFKSFIYWLEWLIIHIVGIGIILYT